MGGSISTLRQGDSTVFRLDFKTMCKVSETDSKISLKEIPSSIQTIEQKSLPSEESAKLSEEEQGSNQPFVLKKPNLLVAANSLDHQYRLLTFLSTLFTV